MNYSRFLTSLSKQRKPSTIREMTNLLTNASPELVNLGGGLPNPHMFPFEGASIKLRGGKEIKFESKEMDIALQYGPTSGYPPLVNQLKNLTKQLHNPPLWEDMDLIITPGSQDGLCKAIDMFLQPNDYFIVQEPCYTGTLAILNPYSPKYIIIESDEEGVIPESLRESLKRWNPADIRDKQDGVPKIMYVNPNACNPTGVSLSINRRKEIYKIACEFNLIILEDDPYYFVQFDNIENFAPSFLSLDVEGRVIRFDSFSKVLSSGIRLGFATGPKPLINRIMLHMQVSVLHTSSLSQVLASKLLDEWKIEGFLNHTRTVQHFYREQRDAMLSSAERHLSDICTWSVPTGGMFLWMKIPKLTDTWDMVMERGLKKDVMLVPGRAFMTDPVAPSNYLRASFSLSSPDKMDIGLQHLRELIEEEIILSKKNQF